MIQSTQCKMLRHIIQTKRRYKKIEKRKDKTSENDDPENLGSTEDENEDGQSSNTCYDQDSDTSFKNDTDQELDTTAIEKEEWIEYMIRSTDEATEKMKNANFRCWIKTHKRMKWRLALRIASLPGERWIVKAAEWNPELSTKYESCKAIGRPKRRWEDEVDEFLKPEETETTTGNDMKYNNTWIRVANNRERWTTLECEYAKTEEERSVDNVLRRDNPPQDLIRPARAQNGVNEVTPTKLKETTTIESRMQRSTN